MSTDYQANVSLWLNCNLKCPYCFARPIPVPDRWSDETRQRLDMLGDFLDRTGRWSLDFSGGEPTIYPGFAGFCVRLAQAGHEVNFYTNGVVPLDEAFPDESIRSVRRVVFSYHMTHDQRPAHLQTLLDNIDYLLARNIRIQVNYVLYPKHRSNAEQLRERFDRPGIRLQFHPFQGEVDGRQYPFAYTDEEKAAFNAVGDIRARFLMENGYFLPTFKDCRAGFETFYIALRTGGVYTCEQLQQRELANFEHASAPRDFRANLADRPQPCPAKRCTCRMTVAQEEFLATHDRWDMANYAAWEAISRPTPEALAYWFDKEQAFATELAGMLRGDTVFVWAGGVHSLMLLKLLRANGFPMERIKGIIDSERFKQGRVLHGLKIISPERFDAEWGDRCSDIIISSRAFEPEIHFQARSRYGDRYNLIRLYDGRMRNAYEALEASPSDAAESFA